MVRALVMLAMLPALLLAVQAQGAGPDTPAASTTDQTPTVAITTITTPPTTVITTNPTKAKTEPTTAKTDTPTSSPIPTHPTTNPPQPTVQPVTSAPTSASSFTIKLVNDQHYRLFPVDATTGDPCSSKDADSDKCVGGLRCLLAAKALQSKDTVWIDAGVRLGYGGDDATDPFRVLKAGPALDALKLLKFDAMSVDADMFRYGLDAAAEGLAAVGVDSFVCANCPADSALGKVAPFKIVTATAACSLAVVGVVSQQRAESGYAPMLGVTEALEAVKQAVTDIQKTNAKSVIVVVGEVSQEAAKAILSGVPDVSAVLYSGSSVKEMTQTLDGKRFTLTLPSAALGKDSMKLGSLVLSLDDKCKLTDSKLAWDETYAKKQTECLVAADETSVKTLLANMLTKMEAATVGTENAQPVVPLTVQTCDIVSCAVGQMAAEGVRAVINQDLKVNWNESAHSVIVPAREFVKGKQLSAGSPVKKADLLALLADDPFMCWANLTSSQLWGLLEDAVKATETFPQLAGIQVEVAWGGDAVVVKRVWMQAANLAMIPVGRDDVAAFNVSMPCRFLDQVSTTVDKDHRGLTGNTVLSDGLRWHMRAAASSAQAVQALVPPVVESRVRAYVGIPWQADLCEDWVGMTVAYTLLVLGSMAMVGYQGYQFWRFRSTLSYIR